MSRSENLDQSDHISPRSVLSTHFYLCTHHMITLAKFFIRFGSSLPDLLSRSSFFFLNSSVYFYIFFFVLWRNGYMDTLLQATLATFSPKRMVHWMMWRKERESSYLVFLWRENIELS